MQAVGSEAAIAKEALAAALHEKGALSVSNATLRDSMTEQMARGVEWRATAGKKPGGGSASRNLPRNDMTTLTCAGLVCSIA